MLDIFALLAEEPHGLAISDISAKLGIARSSTHGVVHTLLRRGYLSFEGPRAKTVTLGAELVQLGLRTAERLDLRTAAREPLEKLVGLLGETVFLAISVEGELVYIDKVSGSRDFQMDIRLGVRRALNCSALGKALLAAMDEEELTEFVANTELRAMTPFSITDPELLLENVRQARELGYAIDRQESLVGICCAGSAVRDHTGRAVGSISIPTLGELFDEERYGRHVQETAAEISRALGWQGGESGRLVPGEGQEALRQLKQSVAGAQED